VLTIHHWSDWRAGLNELARVARRRVVLFTWDPTSDGSWVGQDYFPEMVAMDRARFPDLRALEGALGRIDVRRVPIPADCTDGFFGAYWRRPEALLDPAIRRSISSLAQGSYVASLDRLAADLQSGAWARQYAHLMGLTELDAGYCLVVADRAG
jgi:hypothetical protein